jgi:hypothetical protein
VYVLECKDRRLSVRAILDELKTAAESRDAQAAIGVFSLPEHCPVEDPFTCELPNYLVLAQVPVRRGKPAWRRRWKSSTSKG